MNLVLALTSTMELLRAGSPWTAPVRGWSCRTCSLGGGSPSSTGGRRLECCDNSSKPHRSLSLKQTEIINLTSLLNVSDLTLYDSCSHLTQSFLLLLSQIRLRVRDVSQVHVPPLISCQRSRVSSVGCNVLYNTQDGV